VQDSNAERNARAGINGMFVYLDMGPNPVGGRARGGAYYTQQLNRPAPLGLFYLAATGQKYAGAMTVLDQRVVPFDEEALAGRVAADRVGFVGFYLYDHEPLIRTVTRYIQVLKARTTAKVFTGGPAHDVTRVLQAGGDAVCLGEGEIVLRELLEYVSGSRSLPGVSGIAFLRDGQVERTAPPPPIDDLDDVPFPVRPNVRSYFTLANPCCRLPFMEMLGSRGCAMNCTFCTSAGQRLRTRSPENVVAEMRHLVERHGTQYFGFRDNVFGARPAWLEGFIEAYAAFPRPRSWSCLLHPLSFGEHRDRVLRRLSELKLRAISYDGLSANPDVLEAAGRSRDEPALLADHLRLARKYGILTLVTMIYGSPKETRESMVETERYLRTARPNAALIFPAYPIKGTTWHATFGDKHLTDLPDDVVRGEVLRVMRSLYLRSFRIPYLLWRAVRRNPRWFLYVGATMFRLVFGAKSPDTPGASAER
jgi:radical SAM superfamily enzyme YgiQ (UPF0313 family)